MQARVILVITSNSEKTVAWQERERYVSDFCKSLEDALENTRVCYTTYDDLQFTVINGTPNVFDVRNAIDLRTVSLTHFKNWQYETEEAPLAALYLKTHKVTFFNSEVDMPIAAGKISQMFRLSYHGVPVPNSVYCRRRQLSDMFKGNALPDPFRYPLIMKANDGSRGDDNHLIKSGEDGLRVLSETPFDKQFILQNFIENDGDYRFLFIGLDNDPLVFRRTAAPGSHLNNTSKGGSGMFVELRSLPSNYFKYARRAAEVLGREIGGVDIIVDRRTDKPYVLEVNGTPAIATGYGTDEKLHKFALFLKRSLDQQEEE